MYRFRPAVLLGNAKVFLEFLSPSGPRFLRLLPPKDIDQTMLDSNRNWLVTGFPYHDGYLEGVLIDDRRREIAIGLRDVCDQRRVIVLGGVVAANLTNVKEGNIVGSLWWIPGSHIDDVPGLREKITFKMSFRDSELTKILGNNMFVFWADAAYGAETLVICRDAKMVDGALVYRSSGSSP